MDWSVLILFGLFITVVLGMMMQATYLNGQLRHNIDALESKINSNLERQIKQAVGEAIAKEQLEVYKRGASLGEQT